MSTIFEIFGYRLTDTSEEAQDHRRRAWCPFMDAACDGGGNRYLSSIDLTNKAHEQLSELFPARNKVVPGVCSLDLGNEESPWIVCPRRLLVLGRQLAGIRKHQRDLEIRLLSLLNYPPGTRLGIWKEAKINYIGRRDGVAKKFDYTFDYLLIPVNTVSLYEVMTHEASQDSQGPSPSISQKQLDLRARQLERKGFQIDLTNEYSGNYDYVVYDYPSGKPSIIEIMTSSTSGGNKSKRTRIPQAFEDAMLGRNHNGPGINYRQVWARMASQLLVKSEVALGWSGLAIWVVQDVLIDYISKSTGLNIRDFVREQIDDVNMLSFSYGDRANLAEQGIIDLPLVEFFAGSVAPVAREQVEAVSSFIDIVRLPIQPPLSKLIRQLTNKGPAGSHAIAP